MGLLDYDNDGWLDIYLVNGSTYDAESGKTTLGFDVQALTPGEFFLRLLADLLRQP